MTARAFWSGVWGEVTGSAQQRREVRSLVQQVREDVACAIESAAEQMVITAPKPEDTFKIAMHYAAGIARGTTTPKET